MKVTCNEGECVRLRDEITRLREALRKIQACVDKVNGQMPKAVTEMSPEEYAIFQVLARYAGALAMIGSLVAMASPNRNETDGEIEKLKAENERLRSAIETVCKGYDGIAFDFCGLPGPDDFGQELRDTFTKLIEENK